MQRDFLKEEKKINGFDKLDIDKSDIGKLGTTPVDLSNLSNVEEKISC